jgi:trigger factor
MQVSIETTSGLERRMTIGVPAERVEVEIENRLKKVAKQVKIDGFRPGKIPFKVVKQRYGAGVRQEVVGEIMSQTFYEAVTQEKVQPAGQPSVEPKQLEAGKDLEYVATFEVYPSVELADFAAIEITKPVAEVTDADVVKMIDIFRKQQGSWDAVERAAAEGDQVNINYAGTKDGEAFDGGTADNSDLELGSNSMIPGFEDGIVGLSAGDEKTLELSFPEDYHNEDLKGAAVQFAVKVNAVNERTEAELNEEFFAKYGVSDNGEEGFRAEVKANMERELANATSNKVKTQVMDAVLAANEVDVPKALVAGEIETLRNQMFQQFGAGAENLDKSILPDDMFTEQAERRVRLGLLLGEVIKAEKISPDADKVRAKVEEIASTYQEPEQVVEYYYGNQEQLQAVESAVLEDQVVDTILAKATVTENEESYEDVIAQQQPAA